MGLESVRQLKDELLGLIPANERIMKSPEPEVTLRPLGDRVLVQPDPKEEVTKGGIILPPDASQEAPVSGTVFAAGPGAKTQDGRVVPMELTKGDHVIFSKFSGTLVKVGELEFILLREGEILAVREQ